eukprot:5527084-Amphidinium_carterae.1
MLLRVLSEAVSLVRKGVGLICPSLLDATFGLQSELAGLLPTAHLLHPLAVSNLRAGTMQINGRSMLANATTESTFSHARVVCAIAAGYCEGRSGKASLVPSEARAKERHPEEFNAGLSVGKSQRVTVASEDTLKKVALATARSTGLTARDNMSIEEISDTYDAQIKRIVEWDKDTVAKKRSGEVLRAIYGPGIQTIESSSSVPVTRVRMVAIADQDYAKMVAPTD